MPVAMLAGLVEEARTRQVLGSCSKACMLGHPAQSRKAVCMLVVARWGSRL